MQNNNQPPASWQGWTQGPGGAWYPPSTDGISRLWQCTHCQSTNFVPKSRCTTCGLRKSYVQAAKSAVGKPPPANVPKLTAPPQQAGSASSTSPTHTVAQQLAQVAAKLNNNTVASKQVPAPIATVNASAALVNRADTIAEIKQIEAAILAITSPSLESNKDALQVQLEEKRKLLHTFKTLGQRLDGTKAAASRASKRREQAEEAVKLAQCTLSQATAEEDQLKKELAELEASVAQESYNTCPLQALGEQLAAAVEQLKSIGVLSPDVADDAQVESEALFLKFQATFKAAELAMEQAKLNVPHRMRGKQTPAVPSVQPPVITHRMVGKQGAPTLAGLWGKKVLTKQSTPIAKRSVEEAPVPPDMEGDDLNPTAPFTSGPPRKIQCVTQASAMQS